MYVRLNLKHVMLNTYAGCMHPRPYGSPSMQALARSTHASLRITIKVMHPAAASQMPICCLLQECMHGAKASSKLIIKVSGKEELGMWLCSTSSLGQPTSTSGPWTGLETQRLLWAHSSPSTAPATPRATTLGGRLVNVPPGICKCDRQGIWICCSLVEVPVPG